MGQYVINKENNSAGEILMELVLAGVAFIGLFVMWVIVPSRMRKNKRQ